MDIVYSEQEPSFSKQERSYIYDTYQLAGEERSDYLLPLLTEKEKKLFLEIYGALVNKNAISLLFIKGYLEQQSSKLRHVHPLSTLLFIHESPRMQFYLNKLRKKTFVKEPWERSCKDFVGKMRSYKQKNLLCLDDFLQRIQVEKRMKAKALVEEDQFVDLLVFFLF